MTSTEPELGPDTEVVAHNLVEIAPLSARSIPTAKINDAPQRPIEPSPARPPRTAFSGQRSEHG
jgi:hypothetical protein